MQIDEKEDLVISWILDPGDSQYLMTEQRKSSLPKRPKEGPEIGAKPESVMEAKGRVCFRRVE